MAEIINLRAVRVEASMRERGSSDWLIDLWTTVVIPAQDAGRDPTPEILAYIDAREAERPNAPE